ncbi:MAG: lipopolysaccharide biosynthesis protein [Tannerella sp.]|jgi:O-antigen/teichoic acid export membrane protein|nr:lipopolysaccharide biosynthesis protein [Tannerella sp.]
MNSVTGKERNKKLVKDIMLYGIGNVGSRLLAFLLIPFLTFFLEREEIGYYDLTFTLILFLTSLTTLQMRESTFRLLIDNKDATYRKNIISCTFFIESCIFSVLLLIALFFPLFVHIRHYVLIIISIYTYSIYELYSQAVRALYSTGKYALMGIITSILTALFTFSILLIFKTGIEGLFIGNILSRILSVCIIEIPRREFIRNLSVRHIKKESIKEILHYSIPMLITAIAIGVISSCGKFIVEHLYGLEENGSLAIVEKFMTIISVLGLTFYQAWQETAVKNFRESESSKFFSYVFNKYSLLLTLLVICVSFGLRSFAPVLIDKKFHQGVDLIYIFGIGGMFHCFAMFLEITFQCTKQTSKILYSILSCAIITPIISVFLIQKYGVMGNVVAFSFSFLYLFVFRYFQTKKSLPIKLGKDFCFSMLLLVMNGFLFYGFHNSLIDYFVLFISSISLLLYFLYMNKRFIKK